MLKQYKDKKTRGLVGLDVLQATQEVLLSYMQFDPNNGEKVIVGNKTTVTPELIASERASVEEALSKATETYNNAIASLDELAADLTAKQAEVVPEE